MKRFVLIIAIFGFLLLASANQTVGAQGNGWTPPFQVSDTLPGWFPDIAVAPDDSVHIIWHSGIDKGKPDESLDLLAYRELRAGGWSAANDIFAPATGGYTVRNGLVMGRDGRLHAVLRSKTRIQYTSVPWEQAWSAQAWSTPRTIGEGYYDGLAIDSKGTLHAIWTGNGKDSANNVDKDCLDCSELYYRRSTDGGATWSAPINLSEMPGGEDRPQIKVDQQDRVHIFWDHGLDWYLGKGKPQVGLYRQSDDGGQTWRPTTFSLPGAAIQQLSVASAAEGRILAVYRAATADDVYYQVSNDNGATWQAPAKIPGVFARNINDPPLDIYSMATDSANRFHLLMVGFQSQADVPSGVPALLHLSWNGQSWSAPEVVMRSDKYPEWPRLVAFGGNQLHAVWFTRDKLYTTAGEANALRVWYSSKLVDAPAATLLPQFTPAPVATASPPRTTQQLQSATPTTLPVSDLAAPAIAHAPAWEMSSLWVLGLSLAPMIGVLGLLWILARYVFVRRD